MTLHLMGCRVITMTRTQIPETFYAMDPAGDVNYRGSACSTARPFYATDEPVFWVPLSGGEVTVDDPGTGDSISTGVILTAAEVADRLAR